MIQCAAHMSLCSLGNLSKPGALLHYLQVPFGTTLNLQGTLNKQQWRLQSMQSNLGTTICDLLDQELSTPRPSLSINFCNPWRLPAPPAAGTQVQSAGHLCSSFDLGSELTWGSGTQCCSGHCTLKRKNKQTKKNYPEEKARTRGAWSYCFHQQQPGSPTWINCRLVLLHPIGIKSKLLNWAWGCLIWHLPTCPTRSKGSSSPAFALSSPNTGNDPLGLPIAQMSPPQGGLRFLPLFYTCLSILASGCTWDFRALTLGSYLDFSGLLLISLLPHPPARR